MTRTAAALLVLMLAALLAGCGDVAVAAEPAAAPVIEEESAIEEEPVVEEEPVAVPIDFGEIPVGGMDEYPTTPEECICGDEALELLEQLNKERAQKAAAEE